MRIALSICASALLIFLGCQPEDEEQLPEPEPVYARILGVSAVDQATVYAVGDSLWRSTDGGDHWDRRTVPRPLGLVKAFADGQLWTVGDSGGVFHSADGGESWTECFPDVQGSQRVNFLDFADPVHGWVAGSQWLACTHDGGVSWQTWPATDWIRGLTAVSAMETWYADELIRHTTDGGVTWSAYDPFPDDTSSWLVRTYSHISFSSPLCGWVRIRNCGVMGLCSESLYKTNDGGISWTAHSFPDSAYFRELIPTGESSAWIMSWTYGPYYTSDDGVTWDLRNIPCTFCGAHSDHYCLFPRDMDFTDDNWGWCVGDAGGPNDPWRIVRTTNAGEFWTVQPTP